MQSSPHHALRRIAALIVLTSLASAGSLIAKPGSAQAWNPATRSSDVALTRTPTPAVARTIILPVRANMLGVTFAGDEAHVRLRYRSIRTGWSDWETVAASDIGPDGQPGLDAPEGNTRHATEPVWVGTADQAMIRVEAKHGTVRDVRLHAINTLGDASPTSAFSRVLATATRWFRAPAAIIFAPPQSAQATPAKPAIITRAGWGADERWRRCCPRYAPTVEVAFVHHTVSPNNYTSEQAPAMIRAIYRYHRYSLDYDDIAYNFLVDRFGRIYEGRAGGVDKTGIGAHTEGMNSKTTGVALLGTFSSAYPSGPMMIALKKFFAWKMDVHHIPAVGVVPMTSAGSNKLSKGQVVNMNRISGHRDAQATDCPGNRVYAQIPDVRAVARSWGLPKIYMNSTPPTLQSDGDTINERVTTKVWLSQSAAWKIIYTDATGSITKTATGVGTVGEASWDGMDSLTRNAAQTGIGTLRVEAQTAAGAKASPAVIPIYIVTTHPTATVLAAGAQRTFLDESGLTRAITSNAVYKSWFRTTETVSTSATELSKYAPGSPLGFRDGTILRTPDGAYHQVYGGTRRTFATPSVYSGLGFTDSSALAAAQAEVNALTQGTPIADAASHPDGSVVIDSNKVAWVIQQGVRRRVPSLVVRRSWYRDAEVVPATAADMTMAQGEPINFRPGTILRTPEDDFWLVSAGTRRVFPDRAFFGALGYRTSSALSATWAEIGILRYGAPIK